MAFWYLFSYTLLCFEFRIPFYYDKEKYEFDKVLKRGFWNFDTRIPVGESRAKADRSAQATPPPPGMCLEEIA